MISFFCRRSFETHPTEHPATRPYSRVRSSQEARNQQTTRLFAGEAHTGNETDMSIPLSLVFSKGLWWLSYHVVVLYAVFQCLRPYVASRNASTGDRLWAALALGSLTIAWYHIYQFIYADFLELGEDLEGYLQHSDLFVNAYRKVTENQFGWFFSWQLLAWTCTVLFRMWEQGAVQLLDKEEEGHLAVTFDQPGPMERIWLTIAGFFGAMSTCGELGS